ncbi:hypothetical protein CFII64_24069 [Pseudomonas sp. CFII64]|uniref:hypothetical protein n=1 Tax=Pseudomonas sp. CFII64 TaxID=911242 RepID=UPI000357BC38|nr:hypothetical protein [Pseudomonas sp. CFII64]EPJ77220.1 hypothetical protein CFII64_24069 [Pseudomonas sp. CFII64]
MSKATQTDVDSAASEVQSLINSLPRSEQAAFQNSIFKLLSLKDLDSALAALKAMKSKILTKKEKTNQMHAINQNGIDFKDPLRELEKYFSTPKNLAKNKTGRKDE